MRKEMMYSVARKRGIVTRMQPNPSPARAASRPGGLRVRYEAGLLARATFDAATRLPRGNRGDLADQLRRAATSVYANLAEGEGRATTADRLRCFTIAWGSLRELDALLDLAEYVSAPDGRDATRARAHARHVGRLLIALRRTLADSAVDRPPPRRSNSAPQPPLLHSSRSTAPSTRPPSLPPHQPQNPRQHERPARREPRRRHLA
ncbi:hypothetical protein tb265_30880 [Gemmatimonadetes bacterium T265]|nr:hypothetical protein tb265_30880 [Gemmatimonadetes bacterium T265]